MLHQFFCGVNTAHVSVEVHGSRFQENSARDQGGALWTEQWDVKVNGSTFTHNKVGQLSSSEIRNIGGFAICIQPCFNELNVDVSIVLKHRTSTTGTHAHAADDWPKQLGGHSAEVLLLIIFATQVEQFGPRPALLVLR